MAGPLHDATSREWAAAAAAAAPAPWGGAAAHAREHHIELRSAACSCAGRRAALQARRRAPARGCQETVAAVALGVVTGRRLRSAHCVMVPAPDSALARGPMLGVARGTSRLYDQLRGVIAQCCDRGAVKFWGSASSAHPVHLCSGCTAASGEQSATLPAVHLRTWDAPERSQGPSAKLLLSPQPRGHSSHTTAPGGTLSWSAASSSPRGAWSARAGGMGPLGPSLATAAGAPAPCDATSSRMGGSWRVQALSCWRCSQAAPRRRRQRLQVCRPGWAACLRSCLRSVPCSQFPPIKAQLCVACMSGAGQLLPPPRLRRSLTLAPSAHAPPRAPRAVATRCAAGPAAL